MDIEEIRSAKALQALQSEWSGLWDRCPQATVFQSPEWLLPWWRRLGRGRLRTLALRRKGRLAGLAPLCIGPYYGLPLRCVRLLGTGVSDHLDLLIEPELASEGAEVVLAHLAGCRGEWDLADFRQLPADSALAAAPVPAPLRSRAGADEACPVLPLPGGVEELWARLPAGLGRNVRYSRRRLEREHEVRWETAGEENLGELLEALFRLHQARWRRRGLPGCFFAARVRDFHREAAGGFLARGRLHLHALRADGALIAALYCFADRGRVCYYAGGFDPGHAKHGPGALLLGHALEAAIREGAREWDFLRGDEPYKYRWGAADHSTRRRLLWHGATVSQLAPVLQSAAAWVESTVKRGAQRW